MRVYESDHLVLTVRSIERACAFYTAVLGMVGIEFGHGRRAPGFGSRKLNLHEAGHD